MSEATKCHGDKYGSHCFHPRVGDGRCCFCGLTRVSPPATPPVTPPTTGRVDIVLEQVRATVLGHRFVEIEVDGKGVNFGEWIERPDGLVAIRLPAHVTVEPPTKPITAGQIDIIFDGPMVPGGPKLIAVEHLGRGIDIDEHIDGESGYWKISVPALRRAHDAATDAQRLRLVSAIGGPDGMTMSEAAGRAISLLAAHAEGIRFRDVKLADLRANIERRAAERETLTAELRTLRDGRRGGLVNPKSDGSLWGELPSVSEAEGLRAKITAARQRLASVIGRNTDSMTLDAMTDRVATMHANQKIAIDNDITQITSARIALASAINGSTAGLSLGNLVNRVTAEIATLREQATAAAGREAELRAQLAENQDDARNRIDEKRMLRDAVKAGNDRLADKDAKIQQLESQRESHRQALMTAMGMTGDSTMTALIDHVAGWSWGTAHAKDARIAALESEQESYRQRLINALDTGKGGVTGTLSDLIDTIIRSLRVAHETIDVGHRDTTISDLRAKITTLTAESAAHQKKLAEALGDIGTGMTMDQMIEVVGKDDVPGMVQKIVEQRDELQRQKDATDTHFKARDEAATKWRRVAIDVAAIIGADTPESLPEAVKRALEAKDARIDELANLSADDDALTVRDHYALVASNMLSRHDGWNVHQGVETVFGLADRLMNGRATKETT